MGWTSYDGETADAAAAARLADCKILDGPSWRQGSDGDREAWYLVETWDTHEPLILLLIVREASSTECGHARTPRHRLFWIKEVDETMGPFRYDCPLGWLDRSPERPGFSAGWWRANVRAFHAGERGPVASQEERS